MITENILTNLDFTKQSRSSYQPGWQSHGDVYTKHGLTIDGCESERGLTISDLSGQMQIQNLRQLEAYFLGMGKPSIFK
jgi:hypothetical protein